MTQGASGSYAINGTNLTLPPSTGRWLGRDIYGVDGNAHPIYSGVREFELRWDLLSVGDAQQIKNFYNNVSNTGTVIMDLPEWGAPEYRFKSYTGVTLEEPSIGVYFSEHITDMTMIVKNIRT